MNTEVDVLSEMWLTCKEYISTKDRQAAADHVISVIADQSLTESELKALAGTDSYLERALQEYLGTDPEDDLDFYDESIGDDEY